jgi:hypothetical protein
MNLTRWLDCAYLDSSFPLPLDQAFTTATAVREGVSKDSLVRLGDVPGGGVTPGLLPQR